MCPGPSKKGFPPGGLAHVHRAAIDARPCTVNCECDLYSPPPPSLSTSVLCPCINVAYRLHIIQLIKWLKINSNIGAD